MNLTSCARAAALALFLHAGAAASPLMDLRADDLLTMAPELRKAPATASEPRRGCCIEK